MNILTCSKELRELLLEEYKGLEEYPQDYIAKGNWRHLASMLFAEKHTGIYVGQLQIARDYQIWDKLRNNHLVAIDYINQFRGTILNYTLHEYKHYKHVARTADVEFPQYIIEARDKLLFGGSKNRHEVFICSGRKFNSKAVTNLRQQDKEMVKHIQGSLISPLCRKFQDYLNDLPPHVFTKMLSHMDEAYTYLDKKHPDGSYVFTKEQRYHNSLYLHSIEERPQPLYVGSRNRNTVRLFELHMGLQGIQSDIRRILTQDWIEMDLQNAHLAIVAKVWDIPEVKEYLASGKSIWESLLPYMGIEQSDSYSKSLVKRFLYGCVYGMSKDTLERDMKSQLGSDKHEAFLSHPLIKAVLKARTKRIKDIRAVGGVITYLGEEVHLIRYQDENNKWIDTVLTILSQEASEYEMLLLEPILDLSKTSNDFYVTLYQFDGVSIYIRDKSKKDYILKRIKKAVDKRAKELDILTQVVIK